MASSKRRWQLIAVSVLGACGSLAIAGPPHQMGVAAANPLAAQAGMRVLEAGGSAVDAAIAIQSVLGLVEPQSSGLGGGAFMMVYDARRHEMRAYEGREAAPAGAGPDWFIENGKPLTFNDAVISGHSTGVPGAVAMLGMAHARHGRLPWRKLFADATRLADQGFVVSPRLASFIVAYERPQTSTADAKAYFEKPDGTRYKAGDLLRNPAYAQTLRRLAFGGAQAFYRGPIARDIVAKLAQSPRPSNMTLADIAAYRAHEVTPVCGNYREHRLCTVPPPSSGVSMLQGLALLDHTDIASRNASDPRAWMLLAEAQRLMYADRDEYVADPAYTKVPTQGLLDPQYVTSRAALIGDRPAANVSPGQPPAVPPRAADQTHEAAGTTHFVVVDRDGTVVSMTTTVESLFGSGRMVDGFFLNNQLTDFSFSPSTADGLPIANAVAGRKRPRSSMAPTLIFGRDGQWTGAVGSPGGSAILAYNLKTIVATLGWGMSPQAAIDLPNLIARRNLVLGEIAGFDPKLLEAIQQIGVNVVPTRGEESGLHALMKLPDGSLTGGADRRREGVVLIR